ncbi:aerotaxis receptor protein [Escherichia coli]|uniref:Aerotaxis receptor protein n=1 Tax=Escherichia coli TaxID=562 RepID=A0A2X1KPN6_ECOLX|nr:aerotaxis receptor protein [Escherichia coli]
MVAGEVRHLASRSANAANDIRKLIDASADKVQSGSQQVHAAGRTMEDIVAQVKNVTQLIAQISHSTLEQADGLSSLTRAVDELNLITQKNAELVEESAQVSAMVKHRASRLEDAGDGAALIGIAGSGGWSTMPDAMLAHLIRPAGCVAGVGRIRRVKRRIRQLHRATGGCGD